MCIKFVFFIIMDLWIMYDCVHELRHITKDTKHRKLKITWYSLGLLIVAYGLIFMGMDFYQSYSCDFSQ